MITLYNVVSQDGFIARKNGGEDFIPDELWPVTLSLISAYDSLVLGRNTYEAMQKYEREQLEQFEKLNIKKIVVSSNADFQVKDGYSLTSSLEEALNEENILVSSGPILNESLLSKKIIDRVIWHRLPANIKEGIRPFSLEWKEHLVIQSEEKIFNGTEEVVYLTNF